MATVTVRPTFVSPLQSDLTVHYVQAETNPLVIESALFPTIGQLKLTHMTLFVNGDVPYKELVEVDSNKRVPWVTTFTNNNNDNKAGGIFSSNYYIALANNPQTRTINNAQGFRTSLETQPIAFFKRAKISTNDTYGVDEIIASVTPGNYEMPIFEADISYKVGYSGKPMPISFAIVDQTGDLLRVGPNEKVIKIILHVSIETNAEIQPYIDQAFSSASTITSASALNLIKPRPRRDKINIASNRKSTTTATLRHNGSTTQTVGRGGRRIRRTAFIRRRAGYR